MYTILCVYLLGNVCSRLIHSADNSVSTDCGTRLRGLNEDRDLKSTVKGSAPGGSRSLAGTWGNENHIVSGKVLTASTELSAHSVNDTLTKLTLKLKELISLCVCVCVCVCVYVCICKSSTPANSYLNTIHTVLHVSVAYALSKAAAHKPSCQKDVPVSLSA